MALNFTAGYSRDYLQDKQSGMELESTGQDLVVETTQDFLNKLSGVKTYDMVEVQLVAEENQTTKELRNPRLIDVSSKRPYYDEDELNRAIEKGTKAWGKIRAR